MAMAPDWEGAITAHHLHGQGRGHGEGLEKLQIKKIKEFLDLFIKTTLKENTKHHCLAFYKELKMRKKSNKQMEADI